MAETCRWEVRPLVLPDGVLGCGTASWVCVGSPRPGLGTSDWPVSLATEASDRDPICPLSWPELQGRGDSFGKGCPDGREGRIRIRLMHKHQVISDRGLRGGGGGIKAGPVDVLLRLLRRESSARG